MGAIKILWKILQSALLVLLSIILMCNIWRICAQKLLHQDNPTVFGWTWAVVVTGSMEPVISGNDMIVTQAQEQYRVNDIIMFQSGNMLVTHRIVDETESGFITRGDANNANDSTPVLPEHIVGKVVFTIPGIGTVMGYLKTPLGMLGMVLIGFCLIEIPYLFEKRKNERDEGSG